MKNKYLRQIVPALLGVVAVFVLCGFNGYQQAPGANPACKDLAFALEVGFVLVPGDSYDAAMSRIKQKLVDQGITCSEKDLELVEAPDPTPTSIQGTTAPPGSVKGVRVPQVPCSRPLVFSACPDDLYNGKGVVRPGEPASPTVNQGPPPGFSTSTIHPYDGYPVSPGEPTLSTP